MYVSLFFLLASLNSSLLTSSVSRICFSSVCLTKSSCVIFFDINLDGILEAVVNLRTIFILISILGTKNRLWLEGIQTGVPFPYAWPKAGRLIRRGDRESQSWQLWGNCKSGFQSRENCQISVRCSETWWMGERLFLVHDNSLDRLGNWSVTVPINHFPHLL